MKKNIFSKGFTLIETMIVVAIIVIITTIILVGSLKARSVARDGQRISDLKNLQLKLEQYRTNEKNYPDKLVKLKDSKYIAEIPADPKTGDEYVYQLGSITYSDPSLNCPNDENAEYKLVAELENKRDGKMYYVVCDPYTNPL